MSDLLFDPNSLFSCRSICLGKQPCELLGPVFGRVAFGLIFVIMPLDLFAPPESVSLSLSFFLSLSLYISLSSLHLSEHAKERRRRHAGKRLSKRVFLESQFSSLPP